MAKKKYPLVEKAEGYARAVVAGDIPACKWIKLLCQKHLDELASIGEDDFPYTFNPAKAEKVAKFLQLLPHTKGKWAGKRQTITLEPWQLFAVCIPFGWLRKKDGTRRFRTLLVFVPRKNGKSIIGGGLGVFMFTADGEFGAEVYSGATTEKQAWEVFRPAKQMIERTPDLREYFGVEVNASNMVRLEDGSRFEPVIGKPGDGSSPSCAVVDEYHEHQDSTLFDTMETGMGAREQPIMLVITTAGSSIGGPCHQLVRDSERMLEGTIERPDLWPALYTIDSHPYRDKVQSYHAIKRLDSICKKHSVPITGIDQLGREVFATLATSNGEGLNAHRAKTIPTERQGLETCAAPAMTKSSASETRGTLSGKRQTESSGHLETESESKRQTTSTGESRKSGKCSSSSESATATASRQSNIPKCLMHAIEDAKSAKKDSLFYASIIATIAELSEASCVSSATLQLVFSGILRKVYEQHSDTFKKLGVGIEDGALVEEIGADDWTSREALIKANPNFGISISEDFLLARQRDAMQSATRQATFRTKHLNEWVGAKNAWLNMVRWKEAPPRKSLQELEGRPCFIGLDLASKIDIAGNVLLFPPHDNDPHWHVHGRYYLPEARVIEELDSNTSRYREFDALGLLTLTDGEVVDFETIKEDLREFAGRFDIQAVAFDPWQATQLAQEMEAEGLPMVEIRQTVQNISEPMKELEALTLKKQLAHGDCPILTWMASNVVAKLDVKDNIYPNKERPENKIDGVVALIMALSRAISQGPSADIASYLDDIVIA